MLAASRSASLLNAAELATEMEKVCPGAGDDTSPEGSDL
jgi:hypothetical protein